MFELGSRVYTICYDDGDIQIVTHIMDYKGKYGFIPRDFHMIDERFIPIKYKNTFNSFEEAKAEVLRRYYNGDETKCTFDGSEQIGFWDIIRKEN